MKNEFIEIYNKYIKREGADKLLSWLEKTDFFTAPASTNFHSACKGGLCEHSVKVYKRFLKLLQFEYGENWQERFSRKWQFVLCCTIYARSIFIKKT